MSEEMKREQTESKPRPIRPMRGGRGMPVPKGAIKKGTLPRLIKMVFKNYKWRIIVALICIVINSTGNLVSSVFLQTLIDDVIPQGVANGFASIAAKLGGMILGMACIYAVIVIAAFLYNRIMATVTQGMLYHLRADMFAKMQTLPYGEIPRSPT